MAEHTPGPWEVGEHAILDSSGEPVAFPIANRASEANALLIAAAPDLLAACKAAASILGEWTESEPVGCDEKWSAWSNAMDRLDQLRAAISKATSTP